MKFLRMTVPPPLPRSKSESCTLSILFILLSETIRIRVSVVCTHQTVLLFWPPPPPHMNWCVYTHTTHKESILTHIQPQEAGLCGPGISGNSQPFSSCKHHLTSPQAVVIVDPLQRFSIGRTAEGLALSIFCHT